LEGIAMEYDSEKKEIKLDKELNNLDKFVLEFIKTLEKHTGYVIVSGYVSILLGRSRATEDVDLLIPEMSFEKFKELWDELVKDDFECINTSKPEEGFKFLNDYAIRFFKRGRPTPNIEFKQMKRDLEKYAFKNKIKAIINGHQLYLSPLELQIIYKLFLAADGGDGELFADKDIEDARHLYKLFKEKLNKEEFSVLVDKLNVKNKLRFLE
jgi:sugar-specific transcriptional regulator TrmB